MREQENTNFEKRLQKEIELIDTQIHQLSNEKLALEHLLMKIRREDSDIKDVNRKNSVKRVMIENRIVTVLSYSKKPVPSRILYEEAKHVDFKLKETTFRTHLHRLKAKDVIENGKGRGAWQLKKALVV